jgi:adenylate kinase family enzyme
VPTKIAVVGTTCSGKTTVARRLAEHHRVPHVELDALHWGPNWTEPTAEDFRARVQDALIDSGWVADGGYYGKLGDLVLQRADLVVWLDPPLGTILLRLWTRTLDRIRTGDELWGGNRETWRGAFLSRDSLFLWALKTHRGRRRRYEERLARFESVRLRSVRETDGWLDRHLARR